MFLLKEGLFLIIGRLSFNSNRNFLFSLLSTLTFSKDGGWLQSRFRYALQFSHEGASRIRHDRIH